MNSLVIMFFFNVYNSIIEIHLCLVPDKKHSSEHIQLTELTTNKLEHTYLSNIVPRNLSSQKGKILN